MGQRRPAGELADHPLVVVNRGGAARKCALVPGPRQAPSGSGKSTLLSILGLLRRELRGERAGRADRIKSKDAFEGRSSFRTSLFTVARRQLYQHYERQRRYAVQELDEEVSIEELCDSPSKVLARHQQQRILIAALRRLPIALQVAVELHYFEELTTQELADALGLAHGTAKSRLRRAREQLAGHLQHLAVANIADDTVPTIEEWMHRIGETIDAPS